MALDQAHEQNNAVIKDDGGAVGLTENPSALRRWMVGGPEVSRVLQEFEEALASDNSNSAIRDARHHEQSKSYQDAFKGDVDNLTKVMESYGNPFKDNGKDLLVLHSKDIVNPKVFMSLKTMHAIGQCQYQDFVIERLVLCQKPILHPLKRNKLATMSSPDAKIESRSSQQTSLLRKNCSLFSKLYIACLSRGGSLQDFFMYENYTFPPSLSDCGLLRQTQKSNILECLESHCTTQEATTIPQVDMVIIDGAAIINMITPGNAKTFGEYAASVFLPFLLSQLKHASHRMDVVWDTYTNESLKAEVRRKRGKGIRRRVLPDSIIPTNWVSFLRCNDKKKERFAFLADTIALAENEKIIVTTKASSVLCNQSIPDLFDIQPCNHEEADSRMILHLAKAKAASDLNRFLIRTVDSDVVVLSIAAVSKHTVEELWIAFGVGRHFRLLPAHEIAASLGPSKSACLPLFHSITGCDTVSSFNNIGKKKAWNVWEVYDDITACFLRLSTAPSFVSDSDMAVIERFVTLLYDRTSNDLDVNSSRLTLFTKKSRQFDNIPPTAAALVQHVRRAVYQAGHIWGQADTASPALPSPTDWGWHYINGQWQPFWTHLPQAADVCRELIKCSCSRGCKNRCRCIREGLKCTALCICSGKC